MFDPPPAKDVIVGLNHVQEALSFLDTSGLSDYSMDSLSVSDIHSALFDAYLKGLRQGREGN